MATDNEDRLTVRRRRPVLVMALDDDGNPGEVLGRFPSARAAREAGYDGEDVWIVPCNE